MAITLNWSDDQEVLPIHNKHIELLEGLLIEVARSEGVEEGEVSLTFVDDETIRELNREYRGMDKSTDVLSFPMGEDELEGDEALELEEEVEADDADMVEDEDMMPLLLGDVIISVPTAIRQSEEYGHSIERELGFLFLHGFLHLIGYDHDNEEAERDMISRQEAVLAKAGLTR